MIFADIMGAMGWFAVGVALAVLGRLSARLGKVTHSRAYYLGLYMAAGLVWAGIVARMIYISFGHNEWFTLFVLLADGLPAVGVTLGLLVAWYYWSWLLAERD